MAVEKSNMSSRGKVVLIAQQIELAKLLSGNNQTKREKGIKKLQRYLSSKSRLAIEFTEDDLMRIWKGLFYCMWMSDKPLIQEKQAEMISNVIHCFTDTKNGLLFIRAFFRTMTTEWFGIDNHRLDKFLMLIRRFLRQILMYIKRQDWDKEIIYSFSELLSSTALYTSSAGGGYPNVPPSSFVMHFTDIFLEELAKVGQESLPEEIVLEMLRPFVQCLAGHVDGRVRRQIVENIFHHLMKQTDIGITHEEKFQAWHNAGCPGESCLDMELVEEEPSSDIDEVPDDDDVDPNVKDPRAGSVNVVLPQLQFNPKNIAELLLEYSKKSPHLKNRKCLLHLSKQFTMLASGDYPLALILKFPEELKKKKNEEHFGELWAAAKDLKNFQESMLKDAEADTIKYKKKKRKQENDTSGNQDVPRKKLKKSKPVHTTNVNNNSQVHKLLKKDKISMTSNGLPFTRERNVKCAKGAKNNLARDKNVGKIQMSSNLNGIKEKKIGTNIEVGEMYSKCSSLKRAGNAINECRVVNGEIGIGTKPVKESVPVSPEPLKCNGEVSKSLKRKSLGCFQIVDTPVKKINSSIEHPKIGSAKVQSSTKKRHSYLTQWEVSDISNTSIQTPNSKTFEVMTRTPAGFVVEIRSPPRTAGLKDTSPTLTKAATPLKVDTPAAAITKNAGVDIVTPAKRGNAKLTTPKSSTCTNLANSTPLCSRVSSLMLTRSATTPLAKISTPGSGKKVNIVLQMNKMQAMSEYEMAVKKSPAIPFDANKKPIQGVLKPCAISSPINPFYRLSKIHL